MISAMSLIDGPVIFGQSVSEAFEKGEHGSGEIWVWVVMFV
jgi:hypothetical protein